MWEKIANTILRNRLSLILFLVISTVLMVYKTTQVQMAYDNPKFIPDKDDDMIAYQEFKEIFGDDGSVMVVVIKSNKIFELDFFNDWYDITHQLDTKPNIKQVISLANLITLSKESNYQYFEGDSFETSVFAPHKFITDKPSTQSELDSIYQSVKNLRFYEGLLFNDTSSSRYSSGSSCNC